MLMCAAMSETETPALVAMAKARLRLAAHLGPALPKLQCLRWTHRLRDLAVFVPLAGIGLLLNGFGLSLDDPMRRWLCAGCGAGLTVVAINAWVLLLHEGMHRCLFASARWNRWVSFGLGAAFLMSFTAYRVMHIRHHEYLGDRRDPDDYHNYTERRWLVWLLHFVRLTMGSLLYIFLIPYYAWKCGNPRDRREFLQEYALLALIYSTVLACVPLPLLLQVWIAPLSIVGWLVGARGFTQHGMTDSRDPFISSRSMVPHPLVEACLLGENYHLEHHLFPDVPSYHLKELHGLLQPALPYVVTGGSYIGFFRRFAWAALRLDETPIGLRELVNQSRENVATTGP